MHLWQRKQTLSSGFALGLGSFTAINPWHPCNNYYLMCTFISCCQISVTGEWYFPNGSMVRMGSTQDSFYRTESSGVVHLNRRNDVRMPTVQFCCILSQNATTTQTLCVNIGKYILELYFYGFGKERHRTNSCQ